METITRENITDTDLDFLNFLYDEFGIGLGWEICHCAESINSLLHDHIYITTLISEMEEVRKGYLDTHKDGIKDSYLKLVFSQIDRGSDHALNSDYINSISFYVEKVDKLINGLSRYFLRKNIRNNYA